jgi:large subunit ribosomal protein L7/L12
MEKLTREQFFEHLKGLTLLEVADYIKEFEKTFNISAAPVMMAGGAAPAAEAAKAEEKTEFTAVLKSVGDKKINVIKVVREVTSLGLKEAKDLVDGAPKPIKEGANKEECDKIKADLEAVGATVEVK